MATTNDPAGERSGEEPAEGGGTPEEVEPARSEAAPSDHEMLALLTFLAAQGQRPPEIEGLKGAIRAASHAPGAADPWRWLAETCDRVGLRLNQIERPWGVAQDLLERGPLLARGPSGWLVLVAKERGQVRAFSPVGDTEVLLPPDAIAEQLGAASADASIAWGVVQEQLPAAPASPGAPLTPAWRLAQLFAPDTQDVKLLVVFSLVVGVLNLATPITVEALVNTVAFVGLLQPIVVLALVLAACLGFAAVLRALEAVVVELIQQRLFARVATDLAYRLPRVRREALENVHGPELVNRFFDVTTVQKVGAKLLLDGITAVLSAGIGLTVLAFYHPLLLAFDVVFLSALALIVFGLGRGAVKTAIKESSAKYAVADWLEELVRHPIAFHLVGGREIALDHGDTLTNTYLQHRRAHFRIVLRQLVSALGLHVVTSTVLLGLGGWLVKIGELTLGQLVASWLIVSLVLDAVAKLGRQLEGVYDLLAAADKLGVLFDLPLEEEGGEECPASEAPAALQLIDVGHTWPDGGASFSGVSLDLAAGTSVALMGGNKTTLLEMIQGQRACARGKILYDGIDVRGLRLASLRPQIGLARSGEVITASVAENVRLGRNLSLAEVQAALTAVGVWEAVQALPEGVRTELTSFGRPLSQGQADLLALARVTASKPRLLLIDGALDGLDEQRLNHALAHLTERAPWTLVVATRRLDVARRFERRLRLTPHGLQELS